MQQETVYYLKNTVSNTRIKYYRTRRGARIAMRLRNLHLGFLTRIEYRTEDNLELEVCTNSNNTQEVATYCIEEDFLEVNTDVYV